MDQEILIDEGAVRLSLGDGVAQLQLDRPDSANGLDIPTLQDLLAALMRCHGDARVRVVLLTGSGDNFCAGGNVHTFAAQGEALPEYIRQATIHLQMVISAMIHLDAPVVVAVQGFAAGGGGMGLVCAADLAIAADTAKFLAGATRVGMAPDAGLSVTLPRLIGARRAADWLMTNPVIDAQAALAAGLVNQVVPARELLPEALAKARVMAQGAPRALAATKRLLWAGIGLSVDSAMPEESRAVAELCRTRDVHEGLAAVIGKRAPAFEGR